MKNTPCRSRSRESAGDLAEWLRTYSNGNLPQMERLRRNLRSARDAELTDRQKLVVQLYYERKLSVSEIARQLDVQPSTVSRTLKRAQNRLRHYLRYSL